METPELDRIIAKWKHIIITLPNDIKKIVEDKTTKSFKNKSWDSKSWKKSKNTGKIPSLIDTGKMKSQTKVSTSKNKITVLSNTDYSSYQNYGTNKIPQRQFVVNEEELEEIIVKQIEKELDRLF